jgi:hypothetical protein
LSEQPKRQGNYKPGPGRPPGRKNNVTIALQEAARAAGEAIGKAGVDVFPGDSHAFLTAVYKNPDVPLELRILAAGKALRVEKPTLGAVNAKMEFTFGLAERVEAARQRALAARRIEATVLPVVDTVPEDQR